MAIGQLTYLDLTPEQRAEAAKAARQRVRTAMANPFLTPDQQATLQAHLQMIDKWETGAMPAQAVPKTLPAKPAPKQLGPTHHAVDLSEEVPVVEKIT